MVALGGSYGWAAFEHSPSRPSCRYRCNQQQSAYETMHGAENLIRRNQGQQNFVSRFNKTSILQKQIKLQKKQKTKKNVYSFLLFVNNKYD